MKETDLWYSYEKTEIVEDENGNKIEIRVTVYPNIPVVNTLANEEEENPNVD